MPIKRFISFAAALFLGALASGVAQQPGFSTDIRPLLEKYCFDCHNGEKAKADVNLAQFDSAAS